MKDARGEPPGIYSLPAKVLAYLNLEFDPNNKSHIKLGLLAKDLEVKMHKTIRSYLSSEKEIDLSLVDDTDQSSDIPSTISSALMRRLNAKNELAELEKIVTNIIKKAR